MPAVSSIAGDPYKMGMVAWPTGIQMYRTKELVECQRFCLTNWTGGDYDRLGIEASHSGAGIANEWAAMKMKDIHEAHPRRDEDDASPARGCQED